MYDDDIESKQITQKVAFYLRVSSEDQVEKFGLPLQKESLDNLIAYKGKFPNGNNRFSLAGENYIYIDPGVSGTEELYDRPGFRRLLEDLETSSPENRPFDVLAVYKVDRLARKLEILLKAIKLLDKHEVRLISTLENIDTTTPFGKAILGIMGVIAELEIETTKQRMVGGKNQAIKTKGTVIGSHPVFGYTKDADKKRIILEEEAQVVRLIFQFFVYDGLTTQEIATRLRKDSVLSPAASAITHHKKSGDIRKINNIYHWRAETVASILKDETYLGTYYYNKTTVDPKTKKVIRKPKKEWMLSGVRHTPLASKRDFTLAQKRFKDRAAKREITQRKSDDYTYLLSSLLECDHCKRPDESRRHSMGGTKDEIGGTGSGVYSYKYVCGRKNTSKNSKTCGVIPLPADQLEQYVVEFVKTLMQDPQMAYQQQLNKKSTKLYLQHLEKRIEIKLKQINNYPNRIKQLRDQQEHGHIDIDELDKRTAELKKEEEIAEQEMEKLQQERTQKEMPIRYIETLEEFQTKYGGELDDIFKDRKQAAVFLQNMISKIIVYSRDLKAGEKVAGRPKKGAKQYVPHSIEIVLKLPNEMLTYLSSKESSINKQFGVTSVDL